LATVSRGVRWASDVRRCWHVRAASHPRIDHCSGAEMAELACVSHRRLLLSKTVRASAQERPAKHRAVRHEFSLTPLTTRR
jgi:hypothetical protein